MQAALLAIAATLYGAPQAAFTAERTAQVRAARDRGERELAARIGGLRKPTASARLVNLLVREGQQDLRALLELAAEVGQAQEAGDRAQLREVAARRREVLAGITARTAERAEAAGARVGPGVLEEFQQTLQAALSDPDAAAAVASGVLVRAVRADGLEPVDLAGATALDIAKAPEEGDDAAPGADRADERARERGVTRERAVRARAEAVEARRAADASRAHLRRAAEAEQERADAVSELEQDLSRLLEGLQVTRSSFDEAWRAAKDARTVADDRERAAAEAEASALAAERLADER